MDKYSHRVRMALALVDLLQVLEIHRALSKMKGLDLCPRKDDEYATITDQVRALKQKNGKNLILHEFDLATYLGENSPIFRRVGFLAGGG